MKTKTKKKIKKFFSITGSVFVLVWLTLRHIPEFITWVYKGIVNNKIVKGHIGVARWLMTILVILIYGIVLLLFVVSALFVIYTGSTFLWDGLTSLVLFK